VKDGFMKTKSSKITYMLKVIDKKWVTLFAWLLLCGGTVLGAESVSYEINGFYLGANVEDLRITLEGSEFPDKKKFEAETKGTQLFFVRVKKEIRLYRIIREQKISPDRINATLKKLIRKYGTPDKQQIKTVSIRPKYNKKYNTIAKNKAFWKINETQDFIVEIESKRVVYELIDHDPQKTQKITKPTADDDFTVDENWDPDY
jgi:hypothetical protein